VDIYVNMLTLRFVISRSVVRLHSSAPVMVRPRKD